MSELKPCPFCGGPATVVRDSIESECEVVYESYYVSHWCRLLSQIRTRGFRTKRDAIDVWNRRAND